MKQEKIKNELAKIVREALFMGISLQRNYIKLFKRTNEGIGGSNMIEIKQVSKQYEEMNAIHKLDLSIETGSFLVCLGSNGAGKTTLLKMLAGILVQDEGEITIESGFRF